MNEKRLHPMSPRCYYCHKFISYEVASRNWGIIQAPVVADPEPYEIMWCDKCRKERNPNE